MQTLSNLKTRAIELRKSGLSYNEIRKDLPVAKSTLSLWLKNIPLKKEFRDRLYTKQIQILALGAPSQKERRVREIKQIIDHAAKEIPAELSRDAYQLFGAALYWAEGSKSKYFAVTNSDPHLVLFMVRWFERIFQIKPDSLKASLNIYEQQDEQDIKGFWSDLCGIPLDNFGKSYVKPKNSGYKKNNLYYGTIKVRVPKGTDKRWQTFGWIQKVLKSIDPEVGKTQRKWENLKKVSRLVNLDTSAHSSVGRAARS